MARSPKRKSGNPDRAVREVEAKIRRANERQAPAPPAGRRGRRKPIEPAEARKAPDRGRTRRKDEAIPPAEQQAPLRPSGKTLPPGTSTPGSERTEYIPGMSSVMGGAGDASSGGGAGAGVPDAEMEMTLGRTPGEGDVDEIREHLFPESEAEGEAEAGAERPSPRGRSKSAFQPPVISGRKTGMVLGRYERDFGAEGAFEGSTQADLDAGQPEFLEVPPGGSQKRTKSAGARSARPQRVKAKSRTHRQSLHRPAARAGRSRKSSASRSTKGTGPKGNQ